MDVIVHDFPSSKHPKDGGPLPSVIWLCEQEEYPPQYSKSQK